GRQYQHDERQTPSLATRLHPRSLDQSAGLMAIIHTTLVLPGVGILLAFDICRDATHCMRIQCSPAGQISGPLRRGVPGETIISQVLRSRGTKGGLLWTPSTRRLRSGWKPQNRFTPVGI